MKEFKVLKFLDYFKGIFNNMGVDYLIMRRILQLKLTMDSRRNSIAFGNYNNKDEEKSSGRSIIMYLIMSVFLSVLIFSPLPSVFSMAIVLGAIMFFISLTLIADFSAVMLDVRDRNILLVRPVNPKTINIAKTIHIIIYISKILGLISIAPLAVSLFKNGVLFFIVFVLELIFLAIFIIFVTSIIYYIILSFFDGEKLKDIINIVQIILTITIIIGQQLLARVFELVNLKIVFTPKWWSFIIPPLWMSAPFGIIKDKATDINYYYLTVCSIIIPLLLLVIYIKFMAPYFEKKLLKMLNSEGGRKNNGFKKKIQLITAKLLCKENEERAVYNFCLNMLSSERKLKLQMTPNIAMALIFPFLMLFPTLSEAKSFKDFILIVGSGKAYFSIYLTVVLLTSITMYISRSENYKAAWIYKTFPIENPKPILRGALKATLVKYTIPVFLMQVIIFVLLCGIKIVPDLIIIIINMFLLTCIIFSMRNKELPFSKEFSIKNQQENSGVGLLYMLICAVIAGVHFALSYVKYLEIAYVLIALITAILLWKRMFDVEWKTLK